jgi:DNA polymerase-3 subunit alpha
VYQDDVLLTAITLGGYSWLEADTLRKAMGKKIPAEMAAQKEKLLKGFQEYGKLSPAKGEQLWKLIEPFAEYGFNKAHAACYGKVAYQTAYLKANYPVEYMAAVLTADAGDTEAIATFVAECARLGIPVLPPDVNQSGTDFTVVKGGGPDGQDAIRFGLSSIKNFGEGISRAIIKEREERGPFLSLSEFLTRIESKNLNKKSLESLIKAGALDRFAPDGALGRGTLLANLDRMLEFHRDMTKPAEQDSLFAGLGAFSAPPALALAPAAPLPLGESLAAERDLLGIYVSGHPLDACEDTSAKAKYTIADIKNEPQPGLPLILPVLVEDVRALLTKKGDKMAFVRFADKTDSIEGVIFPKLFKERGADVVAGKCLLIKGTVSSRNGELSLSIENLKPI